MHFRKKLRRLERHTKLGCWHRNFDLWAPQATRHQTFAGIKHSANRHIHWKQHENTGGGGGNKNTKQNDKEKWRRGKFRKINEQMKETMWCNSQRMVVIITTGDQRYIWRTVTNLTNLQKGVPIKLWNVCSHGSSNVLKYITPTEYRDILYQCNCECVCAVYLRILTHATGNVCTGTTCWANKEGSGRNLYVTACYL